MRNENHFYNRILLLMEIAAYAAAFVCALLIRYGSISVETWQIGLYTTLLAGEILMHLLLYFYRSARRTLPDVAASDPAETFAYVVRHQVLLFVLLLLYLFVIQASGKLSRIVLGVMFLLNIALQYLVRMVYRAALKKRIVYGGEVRNYLLITEEDKKDFILPQLKECLAPGGVIARLFTAAETDGIRETLRGETAQGTDVMMYLPDTPLQTKEALIDLCMEEGRGVTDVLSAFGRALAPGSVRRLGSGTFAGAYHSVLQEICPVFGIGFRATRTEDAVAYLRRHPHNYRGRYLCFSNVHTTVMAHDDPVYRDILNGAAFTFADGEPIAAEQRRRGYQDALRVAGPDFMAAMFAATADGSLSHYFYGATQETLDALERALTEKYPGIRIAGMYAPPFRALTEEEDAADIARINASGADFIWIGLGAPKQEKWMAAHGGTVCGVMCGVGAGFDFHAGRIRRAPAWVQKIGMEWFYRLLSDPKRLWKRYLVTNTKFLWYLLTGR